VAPLPALAPFLDARRVLFPVGLITKHDVLFQLCERICAHPALGDPPAFFRAIADREEVTSTGVGGGVAVPHAQLRSIADFVLALAICRDGCDFAAKDGKPVHLVVMIAAPDQDRPRYLSVLAAVATRLHDSQRRERLVAATSPAAALDIFAA